ncbi:MAG: type II secretory pathway pseudopilin PulG [Chlamydiales bacterium]|jgi:type II secretory pathway pseudopilin PulG
MTPGLKERASNPLLNATMKTMHTHKRYFSLLEILIILMIVGIASVGVGFKISKAVQEERFHQDAKTLLVRLQMAHDLMMYNDFDSSLMLSELENGSILHSEVNTNLYKEYLIKEENKKLLKKSREAAQKENKFENIYLSWLSSSNYSKNNKIQLDFEASGERMPQGTLGIYMSPERNLEGALYVHMKGYPRQIYKLSTVLKQESTTDSRDDVFTELYPE